jgi:NifU-like protein involved in Fe-S cluster formation|tara:strand:- start:534 stop:971 length:438 start_codon:yes stop_codon:yes gene_type:complete
MSGELYSPALLALTADVGAAHHLTDPDITETAHSAVCGSTVTVELKINKKNQTVADFGYEVEACALTKAVLAVMSRAIIGQNFAQIMEAGGRLQRLLDEDETVLSEDWGVWEKLKILETAQDYTMRHHSITLPFQAVANIAGINT